MRPEYDFSGAVRGVTAARYAQGANIVVVDPELARRTTPRELPGLGFVRLDAFIVSKKNGRPSDSYWPPAQHDREEWERVLGNATILD